MSKIKLIIVVLLLAYVGYFGWRYAAGEGPVRSRLGSAAGLFPAGADRDATGDPEELPPLMQHRQDLSRVADQMFGPVKGAVHPQTAELERIWNASRADYAAGALNREEAEVLAELVRLLVTMEKQRETYATRYGDLKNIKDSPFTDGMTVNQKREFAEKELQRQWQELVALNRDRLRPLFSAISD